MSREKSIQIVGKNAWTTIPLFSFPGFMYIAIALVIWPITLAIREEEKNKRKCDKNECTF